MRRRKLGILAEKSAQEYLIRQGYRILSTNYHCPYGEIDIIASKGKETAFVEVRSHSVPSMGSPEESIIPTKIERLKKAIFHYLALHPTADWRFDVVVVEFDRDGEVRRLEHIQNALA